MAGTWVLHRVNDTALPQKRGIAALLKRTSDERGNREENTQNRDHRRLADAAYSPEGCRTSTSPTTGTTGAVGGAGTAARSAKDHCTGGGSTHMKRSIARLLIASVAAVTLLTTFGGAAFAQAGHFVGTPTCTDQGTTAQCTGKVAGLGGTTFTINVSAPGTATVECTNPAGNVAPGQTFTTTAAGTTGPVPTPRNGQFRFSVTTATPEAPAGSCPNPQWTAEVIDVEFGDATITLLENGNVSDTITVPVT
jgi:hypothetical protein